VRIMLSRSQPKKGIMMKTNKANKVSFSAAKSKLLNSLILAALAVPGVAMAADPAPTPAVTANVGFVTDYLYRGISQTGGKPAIQGGFDYAHASGFYAGAWGSNISWISDVNGVYGPRNASTASLELDTYFGFKNSFATDFSYDVGFLRYNYPGVYAPGVTKADTNEIYGLIGWKWLTAKYSRSLGDTFGVSSASGTSYIDLSGSYTVEGPGVTLGAHYGKQDFKGTGNSALTYTDYKLSASKDFSGYVVGLAYSSTNTKKGLGEVYNVVLADQSNIDLGKGTAVLSVTHSF
jgi:uncharacterized protein (TIGR02001 family)